MPPFFPSLPLLVALNLGSSLSILWLFSRSKFQGNGFR
jgi:hypothetical protein